MAYFQSSVQNKVPVDPQAVATERKESSYQDTRTHFVFEVHHWGVFLEMPLRYKHGKVLPLSLEKSKRMDFSAFLDMLSEKLLHDIRFVFFRSVKVPLEKGLTLLDGDTDMANLYDLAAAQGLVELYVCHAPQNLAEYYYANISLDMSDPEMISKFVKHESALAVASSKCLDRIIAWQDEEARSPPLRTPPSQPRVKGIDVRGRDLFKDFLNCESHDYGLDLSDDDYPPGIFGVDVPVLNVGWSDSTPPVWRIEVVRYDLPELSSICTKPFEDEVLLDVGGSKDVHRCRSSVGKRPLRCKRVGPRFSPFRRAKMLRFFKRLHRQRCRGSFGKRLTWYIRSGKLKSRVVYM